MKDAEIIKRNPYVSARELAPLVDISHRKIQENIAKLKEYGVIQRIGPAKGGHWEIMNKHDLHKLTRISRKGHG